MLGAFPFQQKEDVNVSIITHFVCLLYLFFADCVENGKKLNLES